MQKPIGTVLGGWRSFAIAAGMLFLASCDAVQTPGTKPQVRPADLNTSVDPSEPSARSASLTRHYGRLQNHLLAQGLLRTDGGGIDTPYTKEDIARNFERIAFFDEYARGGGLRASSGEPGALRKWVKPVNISLEFGASVPDAVRQTDTVAVENYTKRLARITGHPIRLGTPKTNFHVFILSEDDRESIAERVRQIAPDIGSATMALVERPPRSIYCFVLTFVSTEADQTYEKAIALIRSEQPELMRRSCIHEELAQGLGLGNDSATARPSIFNDDEEFALLTSHDEELLRLLYHPTLKPGVSLGQARPLIRRILAGNPGQI